MELLELLKEFKKNDLDLNDMIEFTEAVDLKLNYSFTSEDIFFKWIEKQREFKDLNTDLAVEEYKNYDYLNKIQKYCDNQVSLDMFLEALRPIYQDDKYIEPLYIDFRANPIQFITSREELSLFRYISNKIKETNYKG